MQELARTDMLEMMETQARVRGLAARCKLAEGFCLLEAYQRVTARGLSRRKETCTRTSLVHGRMSEGLFLLEANNGR
jgi:hypothetical protein